MGLFDDILKKPTPVPTATPPSSGGGTSGGGQPPADNATNPTVMPKFVIEKSQETTIFGPKTEDAKIVAQNAIPETPKETVHQEDVRSFNDNVDNGNSIVFQASPVIVDPMMTNTVNSTPEVMEVSMSSQVVETPIMPPIEDPIIVSSPIIAPLNTIESIPEPTPEPIAPVENSSSNVISLGDLITNPLPIAEEPIAPAPQSQSTDNFFESLTGSSPIIEEAKKEVEIPVSENIGFGSSEAILPTTQDTVFASPKEFIEKSLESIDAMIGKIDMRHDAKIEEAEGYGREKERFTDLEKNAYIEAETMDKEKAHTIRMRKLLEKELAVEDLVPIPVVSRGGSLSKIKKASKKDVDEVETLVGL